MALCDYKKWTHLLWEASKHTLPPNAPPSLLTDMLMVLSLMPSVVAIVLCTASMYCVEQVTSRPPSSFGLSGYVICKFDAYLNTQQNYHPDRNQIFCVQVKPSPADGWVGLQMEVQLTPNGKLSGHSGAVCTNVHLLPFHHLIDQQDEIRSQKIISPLKPKFKENNYKSRKKSPTHPPPPIWACSPYPPSSKPPRCSAPAPPCLCNSPKPSVVKLQLAKCTSLLACFSLNYFWVFCQFCFCLALTSLAAAWAVSVSSATTTPIT